jgi:glyoxylase-like metal-dependent hydrolase (beta-lactamase superfamily II)
MILRRAGEVAPGLHVLATPAIPSYLLDCEAPAVFDAGISALGRAYLDHAAQVLGPRAPAFLFLTHAHFDHCGAAAALRAAWGLEIAASARAAEIVVRPRARELIGRLNRAAAELARSLEPDLAGEEEFRPFEVDRVLAPGQRVELGGGQGVEVIASPGHTWDMLSYWLPERGILVASEAAGCPDLAGEVITEFLVDFDAYVASLKRLAALPVQVLCQAHHGVYTGSDAGDYLRQALAAAQDYRAWVEALLEREGGDVERVVELVKQKEYDPRPVPKQPEPAYLINLRTRVEHLKERLARAG